MVITFDLDRTLLMNTGLFTFSNNWKCLYCKQPCSIIVIKEGEVMCTEIHYGLLWYGNYI